MNDDEAYDDLDELPPRPSKEILPADRELLELAARALGAVRVEDVDGEEWVNLHFADGSTVYHWNPLLFYGDTFELAAALELDIMHRVVGGRRVEVLPPGGPLIQEYYAGTERRLPAACRAVVRAATEMGRAMLGRPG